MRKILIATHGEFAGGLKQTMDFVLGGNEKVGVLSAYTTPDFDMDREAVAVVDELEDGDELIVLTDVLGGSVNNEASQFKNLANVHVIAGMNLALVLSLVISTEPDTSRLIEESIHAAKEQMMYMNREHSGEEEDF